MIKMTAHNPKTKRDLVVLGLSEGNLMRLREDKPVHIFGFEMGIPIDIVIFWGETEEKMAEMVKPFIGPDTRVTDETKRQRQ